MKGLNEESLKAQVVTLLKKEFGKWLDENEDLLIERIPERSKIFPMLCGSIVEGFISKGCDLDFSVIIDDTIEKPKIKGKLSREFKRFVNKLNRKVRKLGLDHVCPMAYKLRTTTYLLGFENCKNPQFRVNYFLFGKLIRPNVKKESIKKMLATSNDFFKFKKSFQERYRKRYGYKLFEVKKPVLTNPERYCPKRIYREVQLSVNAFLMAYGLEVRRLTEKMEEELCEKILEITKSTLMKEAQNKMKPVIVQALCKLCDLKKKGKEDPSYKRRRLNFFKKNGAISNDECKKLQTFLKYLLEYVYQPLQNFYEIQVKLTDVLRDEFHADIQWLGLRKDHAFIALRNHEKVKCLDIIPSTENEFDVFVIVNPKTMRDLINKNYDKLFEVKTIDSSLGIDLPFKKHDRSGQGRIHFKLFSVNKDEAVSYTHLTLPTSDLV